MFNNLGAGEILIVLVVLIFLFGGKKLPEIAKGLGESGRELKKAHLIPERHHLPAIHHKNNLLGSHLLSNISSQTPGRYMDKICSYYAVIKITGKVVINGKYW